MDHGNYQFLIEIGFTLNEAKVYLTLLQNRYLNGYEISKLSNVSRSLVYNVIDRLVAKRSILKSEGQINHYCALPYDKVIEKISNTNANKLNIAREKLKHYSRIEKESEYIFNIKGIDEFFSKANDLILHAEKEISISIWKEDFPKIEESLSIASKKGIKICSFDEYLSEYDRFVFCTLAASAIRERSFIKNYLTELVANVVDNDIELCAQCLENYREFLRDPYATIRGITDEKVRSDGREFNFEKSKSEVDHSIWLAQIRSVYPVLEEYREDFVQRNKMEKHFDYKLKL